MSKKGGKGYNKNNKSQNKTNCNYSKNDIRHYTKSKNSKNPNNKYHPHKKPNTYTEVIVVKQTKLVSPFTIIKDKITGNSNNNKQSHNTSHNNNNNNHNSNSHHSSPPYKKTNHNQHKYSTKNHNNNYSSDSSNLSMGSQSSQSSVNSSTSSSSHTNTRGLYPLPCKSGQRWQHIVTVLTRPITNCKGLIQALYQLVGDKQKSQLSCKGLSALLNKVMSANEQKIFYQVTLPFIIQSALDLPALFPGREISLLYSGNRITVELTQDQICSLLAMSFFGLHTWERTNYFPRFNITNLFGYLECVYFEKLKCILHYFYILATENKKKQIHGSGSTNPNTKVRTISIYRHIPSNHEYTSLRNEHLKNNVTPLCIFDFKLSGCIEECENSLQIDFANKYIGGGVLGSGCVQEEIRFLLNTECLVSLLLCECMKTNEAIAIIGTRQFAKYKGYGSSFEFNGNYNDTTATKEYGKYYKYRNCIVAIDAEKYYHNQLWQQYKENKMKRELLKCYTGFSIPTAETNLDESKECDRKLWIATGNWGCGVFGGDIELKCIIQWMAASMAERKIKYFAFGDKGCKYMESFIDIIQKNNITVGMLWRYLCNYSAYRKNAYQHHPNSIMSVFQYIVNVINKSNNQGTQKWILTAHGALVNKQSKFLSPKAVEEKTENHYKFVNKNENNNDNRKKVHNNVCKSANENEKGNMVRQDSFDDNDLDMPSDNSSNGLQADDMNDNDNDKKKILIQNSEKQDSKMSNNKKNEEESDDDCVMVQV